MKKKLYHKKFWKNIETLVVVRDYAGFASEG